MGLQGDRGCLSARTIIVAHIAGKQVFARTRVCRGRSVSSFLYLIPFFPSLFCVLRLSCGRLASRLARCLALFLICLKFIIVTYGYDINSCLAVRLDHCPGFETGQKSLNPPFWTVQSVGKITNRDSELPALKADGLSFVAHTSRLPRRPDHHPRECQCLTVITEGVVPEQAAVDSDVAGVAHAASTIVAISAIFCLATFSASAAARSVG